MDLHAVSSSDAPGRAQPEALPRQRTPPHPPTHFDGVRSPHSNRREQGSTRHELLIALRRRGPASPDGLAHLLGISRTAALQQLRALAAAGLVQRQAVRHGVGRPRHLYDVTPDARTHFPANYDALATSLLEAAQAAGGAALVDRILDQRRSALAMEIRARFDERELAGATLREHVRELAVIQDEQGYLCELLAAAEPTTDTTRDASETTVLATGATTLRNPGSTPVLDAGAATAGDAAATADDALRLREHNCPIYCVAEVVPAICEAEMRLFSDVLGTEVVRETHIMSGGRSCTYRIVEPTPEPIRAE